MLEERKQRGNRKFLSITDASLVERSDDELEGFEKFSRVDKNDPERVHVSYIKRYDAVSGYIKSIAWYSKDLKNKEGQPTGVTLTGWNILFGDESGTAQVDVPANSPVAAKFAKLAENIDFEQPVRLAVFKDKNSGKTTCWVSQNDKTVLQKYTKDTPNGLPQPKQRTNGKWDFGDTEEFLYKVMIERVIPNVQAASVNQKSDNQASSAEVPSQADSSVDEDSIPF